MVVVLMAGRANDGIAICLSRQLRQMLRDGNSRHVGRRRLKLSADFCWGIRLKVPGIQVGRSAVVENENARFCLTESRRQIGRTWTDLTGSRALRQQIRPEQPREAERTNL